MESEKRYFLLKTISPVHTGMSADKDWAPGLDFIQTNEHLLVFKQRELLNELLTQHGAQEIIGFTSLLTDGNAKNISDYLLKKKLLEPKLIEWKIPFKGETVREPIKRVFTNGLGIPTIPGSGIKGALRSIIGNRVIKDGKVNGWDEEKLFGKIDNSLMQLIQVADVPFVNIGFKRLKTFSADGHPEENPEGKWKHQKDGGHSRSFNPEGFVNYYQVFEPGFESGLALNFPTKLKNDARLFENYVMPESLLDGIRKFSISYLKKELEYLEIYEHEHLEQVQDFYTDMLNKVRTQNAIFLRIGAGVGYYSITGDWKYNDHLIWKENKEEFNDDKKRRQILSKTRKMAFEYKEKSLTLLPLGWVELIPTDETNYRHAISANQQLPVIDTFETNEESLQTIASNESKPEIFKGKLKAGLKLRAKKVSVNGKQVMVSLYAEGLENSTFSFSYGNPSLLTDEFYIQISGMVKDKIQTITYAGSL